MAVSGGRVPARVYLPFGYVIPVRMVSRKEMRKVMDGQDLDGGWDPKTRRIYLYKGLRVKRKRYMLLHELAHALNDMLHELLDDGTVRN